MAVTTEIAAMYRRPRDVIREKLALPPREDRVLSYLLFGCLLLFVAQSPSQAREAYLNPEVPLEARLYWSALFYIFVVPLAMYALAAVSHLVARLMGGQGTWHRARLALFWTILAAAPMMLCLGLLVAFVGRGTSVSVAGGLVALAFLGLWGLSLIEAERPRTA